MYYKGVKMLTIRLDPKQEMQLQRVARMLGMTKSKFVRHCINEYMQKYEKPTPWVLGHDLFGKYGSDDPARSDKRKEIETSAVRRKWNGK